LAWQGKLRPHWWRWGIGWRLENPTHKPENNQINNSLNLKFKKMRRILLLVICMITLIFSKAQDLTKAKIENVSSAMISNKYEVKFAITKTAKNEKVKVKFDIKLPDGIYSPQLISGDTGLISRGNHAILWDMYRELDEVDPNLKPELSIIKTTHVLKSQNAFLPGFGNKCKLIATLSYACIIGGGYQYYTYNSNFTNYKNETDSPFLREDYYNKSVMAKKQSLLLLGSGLGLLATNLLLSRAYNNKYNLAYLNYQDGAICMTYVHSFKF
jgi:hypothetical protein